MSIRNNVSHEVPHDFTVGARAVVEETIGRRLAAPAGGSVPQNEMGRVIDALARRNNIRSTVRLTGLRQDQVKAVIVEAGNACMRLRQTLIQNLVCRSLQCIAKSVLQEKNRGEMRDRARLLSVGSAWAWTSIDPQTAFVFHWRVAPCNGRSAGIFLRESAPCRPAQVRLRVDGRDLFEWRPQGGNGYVIRDALQRALGPEPDYDVPIEGQPGDAAHGATDPWLASLSEGFVRKIQRHSAMLSLLFTYHNFAAIDPATKTTPAVAAGIANRPWPLGEMVERLSHTDEPRPSSFK